MRNDVSAPRFDEDNPRELASYFGELEYLFHRHRVESATERKQSAVRYLSASVRELWQCTAAWGDPTRSYEDFKAEVYAFYPEATDAFRYTPLDLEALVNEQAQCEMQSVEDLGAFYRKFIAISTHLIKTHRLSASEQVRWFLGAFTGDQAARLWQLLEPRYNDIPDLGEIFLAVQFVLRHSPGVRVAIAPEVPWHLEKRKEATAAHIATAAATLATAPSIPSTTSSLDIPIQYHAIPPLPNPSHSSASHHPLSVTSLPPMPSAATHSTPLSANVGAFVPKTILIKNASGQEVNLAALRRTLPAAVPPVPPPSTSVQQDTKRPPIQIESQEQQENHHTPSGRPSVLGQGVSITDGVDIPRGVVKQGKPNLSSSPPPPRNLLHIGSSVTFGSMDDVPAPISSSPASAPAVISAEGVQLFGSVAFQNSDSDAAMSAVTNQPIQLFSAPTPLYQAPARPASTPPLVAKFDEPCGSFVLIPSPEAASPALRYASLPSQAPNQSQPYSPAFTPGTLLQGQNSNFYAPPSPIHSPPTENGQSSGVDVSGLPQAGFGGPNAGPVPSTLSSPRLTPYLSPGPPSPSLIMNGNPSAPPSPIHSPPTKNDQNSGVDVSGLLQAGSGGPNAGPVPTTLSSPRLTSHLPPGPPSPSLIMWSGYHVRVLSLPFSNDVSTIDISVCCSITLHSSHLISTSRLCLIHQAHLHHPRV